MHFDILYNFMVIHILTKRLSAYVILTNLYLITLLMCLTLSSLTIQEIHHLHRLSDNVTLVVESQHTKFSYNRVVQLRINEKSVVKKLNQKFLSVGLGPRFVTGGCRRFNTSSQRLVTLLQALAPTYLRVGGTQSDLLRFQPYNETLQDRLCTDQSHPGYGARDEDMSRLKNITLTAADWDRLNQFAVVTGSHLVFDENVLLRSGNAWDSSNAQSLMNYTQKMNYSVSLELGNEPNAFRHTFGIQVLPEQLAEDFNVLKKLMKGLSVFQHQFLIGPDVTQMNKKSTVTYLYKFLDSGGKDAVDVVTWHHYYVPGKTATLEEFLNPNILDSLKVELQTVHEVLTNLSIPDSPVWLGETGSASGGGAPGLSNTYVAGFMWLDKLGLSALHGIDVVVRQDLYGSHYALLEKKTFTPTPDYWLSLLYKMLVGDRVLDVRLSGNTSNHVRAYAHCTNTVRSDYLEGSVTVYVMNLLAQSIELMLAEYTGQEIHKYLLTPTTRGDVKSKKVCLNGVQLVMQGSSQLPPLKPAIQTVQPILFDGLSFGFLVIPYANVSICT